MSLTSLLFVFAFICGCMLAVIRHPIYGLLTYVGAFYLHPPSRWWGQGFLLDVRWSLLAAAVTVLAVLLHQRRNPARPPFIGSGFVNGFALFTCWLGVQSLWALDSDLQYELFTYYCKFLIVLYMMHRCIEGERELRLFLWAHVLGCTYFGWLAFTSHQGGRFQDFGGPGLGEANAAALQLVTGIFVAGSLFLAGSLKERLALVGLMALPVNAVVATVSRGAFLAGAIGGLLYNLFAPTHVRGLVKVLSVVAVVLFTMLTSASYWERISSVKYKGQEIEGLDTGASRLRVISAQWRMSQGNPFGCGHRCTEILSPSYLSEEDRFSVGGAEGTRASHNTVMTLLVEQGIVGVGFYGLMLIWIIQKLREVRRITRHGRSFVAFLLPAVAASLAAIVVADQFRDYIRSEVRIWFFGVLFILTALAQLRAEGDKTCTSAAAK